MFIWLKKLWRRVFGRKELDENTLESEIRKKYPELDWKDVREMMLIARETGIYSPSLLREELMVRKAERVRREQQREVEREARRLQREGVAEARNLDLASEEWALKKREEERERQERIFAVGRPAKVDEKTAQREYKKDMELIKKIKLPEEEKTKLKIAAAKEKESKIKGVPYGLPEGFPEEVKPISRWKQFVFWAPHKLEPEETRIIRAIAWAKRRLDFIARKKNKEIILKHKIMKLREYARNLGLKEAEKEIRRVKREIRDIRRKIEDRRRLLSATGPAADSLLESLQREYEEKSRELQEKENKYKDLIANLENLMRDTATDLPILKEVLRGEVPRVVEEAKKMFHIYSPYLIERLQTSLEEFADAEAAKMIETNFKTIYQAAGLKGFFVKEIYRPIGGVAASAYDLIGYTWRFIFEFIFSPVVIGSILLWLLFSIFARYVMTGPVLVVLIITIIITVLLVLGEYWARILEMSK